MKNKNITSEELKKFIAKEAHRVLNEESDDKFGDDVISTDKSIENTPVDLAEPDIDNSNEDITSEFSNLNPKINNLSKKLNGSSLKNLDEKIKKVIDGGRLGSDFNYNAMSFGKKINDFNYLTTVLASLYHSENISDGQKTNIRKSLWEAMYHPHETTSYERGTGEDRPSLLSSIIANKAGIREFRAKSRTIDGSYYRDIIADSIAKAIDYMLDNFKVENGSAFPTGVIFNAASRTMSEVQSNNAKTSFSAAIGGRNYIKSQSLDEPLGDSDDERDDTKADRVTGEEGGKSTSQKEAGKELASIMTEFIENRLIANIKHGGTNPAFLEVAKLLFKGHNLAEIGDILGAKESTVRQWKARMQALITEYVKNGSFQKYIKDKTGIKVNFPDNKYTFSVQGIGEKESKEPENSLEYFEQTGIDPETGEPKGEWVPITPNKESEEEGGGYYDKYGNLAFGEEKPDDSEEENNLEEPEDINDLGPDDDDSLNESFIAKELAKRINNRILKEFGNE
jgi:DNA-binding CsgD family transcriptional regulator